MSEPHAVGVGYSSETDAESAAAEAVQSAVDRAGLSEPNIVIAFGFGKYDRGAFAEGLRGQVSEHTTIFGGSTGGVITNDVVSYGEHEAAVLALGDEVFDLVSVEEQVLKEDEAAAGGQLGDRILEQHGELDGTSLVLLYDSIREMTEQGPILNEATPILQGLRSSLGSLPKTVGAGVAGSLKFAPCWLLPTVESATPGLLGGVVGDEYTLDSTVLHGCRPAGGYHTITAAEGNVVLEIDGEPAVEAVQKMVGADANVEDFPLFITLGVNRGEKYEEFDPDNYQNRLVLAIDEERGGLVMFEPDLEEGMEVQLMRRSLGVDYIQPRLEEFWDRIDEDRTPEFALYFDCAGRASVMVGTDREEASEVADFFDSRDVPLLGTYTGVEIGEVRGEVMPLDYTGVVCVFSR